MWLDPHGRAAKFEFERGGYPSARETRDWEEGFYWFDPDFVVPYGDVDPREMDRVPDEPLMSQLYHGAYDGFSTARPRGPLD